MSFDSAYKAPWAPSGFKVSLSLVEKVVIKFRISLV